jgi:hypothetical protein
MKIVTFQGGLGNQMFQYQFYLWLKEHTNDMIFGYFPSKGLHSHNGLEVEKCFSNVILPNTNIFINYFAKALKLLRKIGIYNTISTFKNFNLRNIMFEDYWLDLQYVSKVKFEIKRDLILKNERNTEILKKIKETNSVSVHIRRNDYLSQKFAKIYFGICDVEYYQNAIDFVLSKSEESMFYIFSDDIDWCKENMNIPNANFVDWNNGKDSVLDLYLMSCCRTNIIANSTFSWWSAFNNDNEQKIVITPRRWFNEGTFDEPDIFPKEWIIL